MMWALGALAAGLAFLAGLLSYHVPLFACAVAWACGVATGVWGLCALVDHLERKGLITWKVKGLDG